MSDPRTMTDIITGLRAIASLFEKHADVLEPNRISANIGISCRDNDEGAELVELIRAFGGASRCFRKLKSSKKWRSNHV